MINRRFQRHQEVQYQGVLDLYVGIIGYAIRSLNGEFGPHGITIHNSAWEDIIFP